MVEHDTWQVILDGASQVFTERGYKGATLDEITSRIKMTKGALYHYVSSKEELWLKCHIYTLDKATDNVRPIYESSLSPDIKLYEMIKAHVQGVIGSATYYTNYSFEKNFIPQSVELQNLSRQRDEFEQLFSTVIRDGIELNIFYPVDVKFAKLALIGSMNYITNWYTPQGKLSPLEIAEKIAGFFFTGFLSRPAKNDGLLVNLVESISDFLEKERLIQLAEKTDLIEYNGEKL
ncbi:MAG: TetR/AcrR family transcriptional regulator [Desulfitobacteriaceae bacterium]|nr:TetR/AcrR family transcriptional regulator [Desulfitobacteriaceae bacterium]MDD4345560.1 TetR/AcrR family transcriptional regulator [Desulfitobacteriaceae bacterium]MDD4401224.1 TetR/AcrR family transcriptional regulator [Desulfitobacteriaceae bacterium]